MFRPSLLSAMILCCGAVAIAGESPKDWKPVTVDGEDVAAVSTAKFTKRTRVRLTVTARDIDGVLRLGEARKDDAPIVAMTTWENPKIGTTNSESIKSGDAFICIAVGPKDAPLKLEAVETKEGYTELRFEKGWIVQVAIVGIRIPASQPKE